MYLWVFKKIRTRISLALNDEEDFFNKSHIKNITKKPGLL